MPECNGEEGFILIQITRISSEGLEPSESHSFTIHCSEEDLGRNILQNLARKLEQVIELPAYGSVLIGTITLICSACLEPLCDSVIFSSRGEDNHKPEEKSEIIDAIVCELGNCMERRMLRSQIMETLANLRRI